MAEPPFPRFHFKNVVITPNSWHGRLLLLPSAPPKPTFRLLTPISCLIVRDRHDRRLRGFFHFPRPSITRYFGFCSVFCRFLAKNGHFPHFSEVYRRRSKFRKLKIPEYSSLFLYSLRSLMLFSCCDGRFRCVNPGEWRILPGQSPSMSH